LCFGQIQSFAAAGAAILRPLRIIVRHVRYIPRIARDQREDRPGVVVASIATIAGSIVIYYRLDKLGPVVAVAARTARVADAVGRWNNGIVTPKQLSRLALDVVLWGVALGWIAAEPLNTMGLRDLFQLIDKLQRVAEQPDYIIKANRRVNHFEYNPARFMADQSPVIRLVRVQPRFYISK